MAVIKGQNLRVLIEDDLTAEPLCVAASTSCTLHVSAQVEDSSTKDSEGAWAENEVTGINWDVSVDALVTIDDTDTTAKHLEDLTVGSKYIVRFSQTAGEDGEQNRDAVETLLQFSGYAYLTDLSVNAPNRQNATFTAQFTGDGTLAQYSDDSSGS